MSPENLYVHGEPVGRRGRGLLVLLVGVVLGVGATILIPRWAEPYLPEVFRTRALLEGEVLAKEMESDRLLLKVSTKEGVLLATFTQRQKEIDVLVETGDIVTLGVDRYQPFLEEPTIERMRKPERRVEPAPVESPPPQRQVGEEENPEGGAAKE